MDKFLITEKSYNRKTGPMMVTTSPRATCPLCCPLRKSSDQSSAGGCYAEHGFIGGYLWTSLDRTGAGLTFQKGRIKVYGFAELLAAIRRVPEGHVWRHNQAGDLPTSNQRDICPTRLHKLVEANRGRRGFTFTHYDVLHNRGNRRLVTFANANGFTINLSANDLDHADQLIATGCGPVTTLLPADQTTNTTTPNGHKVVICPAISHPGATCLSCKLCARAKRNVIVGYPAHGAGSGKIA
ncbi:MAG: hypothetical protein AAGD43_07480 [Pseudomonadota bacterium]